ncbi:hypothetical protein A8C75_12095 [Marinobacterium aestuarii]|uniref:Uncharacterized protein n=1 Tax=Marinobacterium aestuarii TaxID=1821621 RepID=A0A1A9EZH7_9GAMM|nr:hypothetical protein A8C75_12095 [Marinobacterium aestuarii]
MKAMCLNLSVVVTATLMKNANTHSIGYAPGFKKLLHWSATLAPMFRARQGFSQLANRLFASALQQHPGNP